MYSKNAFNEWYASKFGNGLGVADQAATDIDKIAASVGLDWSKIKDKFSWKQGAAGKKNFSAKADKASGITSGSVGVYASMSYTKDGIEFPTVTFTTKGSSIGSQSFNGWQWLLEEYEHDGGGKIDPQKKKAWEEKRKQREAILEKQREAARVKNEKEEKERAENVAKELKDHEKLPRATSFIYTSEKSISRILDFVDARIGSDKHGNFISLLLTDVKGEKRGVQRIYDRLITKKDGTKTNKDFTWGMEKDGAHLIIGDLATADRIFGLEGFATGGSVFLAHENEGKNVAVIVGIDAGNLIKVVSSYLQIHPDMPIDLALDNDLWKAMEGKGNKGLLIGVQLLEKYPNLKAWYPNFDKIDPSLKPTDYNDLHQYLGLKNVYNQLKPRAKRLKVEGDPFERRLLHLKHTGKDSIHNEAKKAVLAGMNAGIAKYSPKQILNTVKAHMPKVKKKTMRDLREYARTIFKAKVRDAQAFRSFTQKYTNSKKRPEHITYTKFNQSRLDEKMYNHIMSLEGLVIVRMPMGSGKTKELIKPAIHTCYNAAAFCHRTSLVGGSYEEFNNNLPTGVLDVVHYQDRHAGEMLRGGGKLAACINSSIKSQFAPVLNDLDGLFIDEASQTLRHTTAGAAVKYPVAVFHKILNMASTAKKHVVMADADANDTLVEFCELALELRNSRLKAIAESQGQKFTPQKIHIIDGVTDCSNIRILHTDSATAFIKATKGIIDGHKTLIANDSADDAEKLFTHIQNKAKDKKGLLVTMDTKPSRNVQAFLDQPNAESKKYDYIIYSPAISSGVSITNGHFKKHYGLFCGTVAPSDAIQMVRRDRKARELILGLATKHSSRETDPLNMWISMLLANDNGLEIELDKAKGAILLKTQDLQFDRFRLELISQENRAKNDFANNMLYMLYADGYKVDALDIDEIEQEQGKMARKDANEEIKTQEMVRHLNQTTPTPIEYMALEAKANLSKDEKARLNRWNIENKLMMPVTEDSITFLERGGLKKVRLMELLQMLPDQAEKFDQAEIKSNIQPSMRTYAVKQQKALQDFFRIAGIDFRTGKGSATPESLRNAVEYLTTGDRVHLFNNIYKFGGFIKSNAKIEPLKVFKSVGDALGLASSKMQLGQLESRSKSRMRYFYNSDTWGQMQEIQTKRNKVKVSAFNVKSLAGEVIHDLPSNYIEEPKPVDQVEPAKNKASNWECALEFALNMCKIPLKNMKTVVLKMQNKGLFTADGLPAKKIESHDGAFNEIARILGGINTEELDFTP